MKSHDREENLQIRLTKEEKEGLRLLSEELSETMTENLVKGLELRKQLLDYIIDNDLNDEDLSQFRDIVLIIVNNLKICSREK